MTRAPTRACAFCGLALREDQSRFEVRMAPGLPEAEHRAVGVFCDAGCWEAASVRKTVHSAIRNLHDDAEMVLSAEGKMLRG